MVGTSGNVRQLHGAQFERQLAAVEIRFAKGQARPKPGIRLPRLTAAKQSLTSARRRVATASGDGRVDAAMPPVHWFIFTGIVRAVRSAKLGDLTSPSTLLTMYRSHCRLLPESGLAPIRPNVTG